VKYQVPSPSAGVLWERPVTSALWVGADGLVPHRTSYCVTHGVEPAAQVTFTDAANSELQLAVTVPGAVMVVAAAAPRPAADAPHCAAAGAACHTMADSPSATVAMHRRTGASSCFRYDENSVAVSGIVKVCSLQPSTAAVVMWVTNV
jgi:hypothetical protein